MSVYVCVTLCHHLQGYTFPPQWFHPQAPWPWRRCSVTHIFPPRCHRDSRCDNSSPSVFSLRFRKSDSVSVQYWPLIQNLHHARFQESMSNPAEVLLKPRGSVPRGRTCTRTSWHLKKKKIVHFLRVSSWINPPELCSTYCFIFRTKWLTNASG